MYYEDYCETEKYVTENRESSLKSDHKLHDFVH